MSQPAGVLLPRTFAGRERMHATRAAGVAPPAQPASDGMAASWARFCAEPIVTLAEPDHEMAAEKRPRAAVDVRCANTLVPPLLWPLIVTRVASPPKA